MKIGQSSWFDLPAQNVLDAVSFYEKLLGWVCVRQMDLPLTNYWMIQKDGVWIGGLREMPRGNARKKDCDAPVIYFTVEELEPMLRRIQELGGTLVGSRVELGADRGVYHWFRDREENLVALWAPH